MIIDNANKIAEKQLELFEEIQDYAKRAADQGTATVVFVSSEGGVPRRMMGKFVHRFSCFDLEKISEAIRDHSKSKRLDYCWKWKLANLAKK